MLNYHELTMNESRDSPARRKQFLVICVGGAAVLLNALFAAGMFEPVVIYDDGIYPGGEFIFKQTKRDYAASIGLSEQVASDLNLDNDERENLVYSVYLDNTEVTVPAGEERFMVGILIDDDKKFMKESLLEINDSAPEIETDSTDEHVRKHIKYEIGDLPSVRCFIAKFPYTHGFVSALMHTYKVYPALVQHAKENNVNGNTIIISNTCNVQKKVCTHYVPMIKGDEFLLGQPKSADYLKTIPKSAFTIEIEAALKGLKKVLGFKQ